jgi:hypothetical protein
MAKLIIYSLVMSQDGILSFSKEAILSALKVPFVPQNILEDNGYWIACLIRSMHIQTA